MTPSPRRVRRSLAVLLLLGAAAGCVRRGSIAASVAASPDAPLPPPPPPLAPSHDEGPATSSVPAFPPAAPPPQAPPPPAPPASPGATAPSEPPPATLAEALARLARAAASGADPDLAGHADLLAAALEALGSLGDGPVVVRWPALEAPERARPGTRTAVATVATYVAPDASPDAVRAAHLDHDRVPEWTGKPGPHVVSREAGAVTADVDATRRVLGKTFGARWRFRSRSLDRGAARVVVSNLVDAPGRSGMLATRGLLVAFPERCGTRVVEAAASALDVEIPAPLRGVATSTALAEMRARIAGLREHAREYERAAASPGR